MFGSILGVYQAKSTGRDSARGALVTWARGQKLVRVDGPFKQKDCRTGQVANVKGRVSRVETFVVAARSDPGAQCAKTPNRLSHPKTDQKSQDVRRPISTHGTDA